MQFQLIFFFLLASADIKAAPVSASWTATAAEMLAECVRSACVCVSVGGLDGGPALGIFVLINTSLHTFYLRMLWRLEEKGVGSLLRTFLSEGQIPAADRSLDSLKPLQYSLFYMVG